MTHTRVNETVTIPPNQIARGTLLAALAAVAFGVTAPFVARAGTGVGPFATGSLLYLGAAGAALVLGGRFVRAGRGPTPFSVLGPMVAAGAVVAPAAFAWGLARTGATTGSLLLNLEAGFTALLAALVLKEHISRRVVTALVLIAVGGISIGIEAARGAARVDGLGVLSLVLATAAWGFDNVLARRLEHVESFDVVLLKGALGGVISALIAGLLGESWPSEPSVLALLACGAFGYGLSLRLYLAAQKHVGAARTGSVFAVAPFIGAAVAWLLGDRTLGWGTVFAATLFASGITLHATEKPKPPG